MRIGLERGGVFSSRWRMEGPSGTTELVRTSNALFGALCLAIERDGEQLGTIEPEGPWRYRPVLAIDDAAPLQVAEAVFALWTAYRMEARRPSRSIGPGSGGGGQSG